MNELNERLVRLNDLRGGFWAIDPAFVNIDDFCDSMKRRWGGGIVRVSGNPRDHISFFFENGVEAEAIAGWVSEDA